MAETSIAEAWTNARVTRIYAGTNEIIGRGMGLDGRWLLGGVGVWRRSVCSPVPSSPRGTENDKYACFGAPWPVTPSAR